MTKVKINGRTYCVETLIFNVKRLTEDVKASAEYHKLVLEEIKAEIEHMIPCGKEALSMKLGVLDIIDKYTAESD